MGIDATIEFETIEGVDLQKIANSLYRRMSRFSGRLGFKNLPQDWMHVTSDRKEVQVMSYWRWFGPGYERGNWAEIRMFLYMLLKLQEQGKIGSVWYYPDTKFTPRDKNTGKRNRSQNGVEPLTYSILEMFDNHFISGSLHNDYWEFDEEAKIVTYDV